MSARRVRAASACLAVLTVALLSGCAGATNGVDEVEDTAAPSATATPEPTLEIAAVADPGHGWISVSGTVTGVAGQGTCTVTISHEGEEERVRTSTALPSERGTTCGHLSVEVAASGLYEIRLEVTELTPDPLTAETSIEYTAA